MEKLTINIERCEVQGGAQALTQIVQEMDRRLQEMAQETEIMKGQLFKFSNNNTSEQYQKAALAIYNLSDLLFNSSEQLNDMQRQIVRYQEKIARFNDRNDSFVSPQKHSVEKVRLTQSTGCFQFTFVEMTTLNQSIVKYVSSLRDASKRLNANKDSVGSIWRDPQYRKFSDFINIIIVNVERALGVLTEYSQHLAIRIKELNN